MPDNTKCSVRLIGTDHRVRFESMNRPDGSFFFLETDGLLFAIDDVISKTL